MSFFDFLLKFWWLELIMLAAIFYAAYQGIISVGMALLGVVVSFIIFSLLSRSGLE